MLALPSQMIADRGSSLDLITDQPFAPVLPVEATAHLLPVDATAHVLPVSATAHGNTSTAAGYHGPTRCLRHVYNAQLRAARAVNSRP